MIACGNALTRRAKIAANATKETQMGKKIVTVTDPDEFIQAGANVYANRANTYYKIDPSILEKSAKYWEDWEVRAYVQHALEHPNPRMDVSAFAKQGPIVKSGKLNKETGEVEYPMYARVSTSPDIPTFGVWEIIFSILFFAWVPLQFWIEQKTGYKASIEMLCLPLPIFIVLFGIARVIRIVRSMK